MAEEGTDQMANEDKEHRQIVEAAGKAQERAANVLAELVSVANADRVYREPVVAGDMTVITAAEIQTGMGFGYGLNGGGWSSGRRSNKGQGGPRGGGGGGGQANGRPVAIITVGSDGVSVQPVLDRTKIVATALTAAAAIGMMLVRPPAAGRRFGRRSSAPLARI